MLHILVKKVQKLKKSLEQDGKKSPFADRRDGKTYCIRALMKRVSLSWTQQQTIQSS
jgi:hypothetical protein